MRNTFQHRLDQLSRKIVIGAVLFGLTIPGLTFAAPAAWQFGRLDPGNDPLPTQQDEERQPLIIDGTPQPPLPQDALPGTDPLLDITQRFDRGPDQKVVVREKFAGWREANLLDRNANLGENLRANWIMLTPAGRLGGQVLAASDADSAGIMIYLLNRGKVVNQARADETGAFYFDNVSEGTYSMIGLGPNAFFAFGLNALEYRDSTASKMSQTVSVMAVQNKTSIHLDWIRHFAPVVNFRIFGRFETQEGTDDPAELYGREGLATHGPAAINSTSIAFHSARLAPGGRLVGRIHQMDELNGRPVDVRGMRVMLLQNDDVVTAVSVDNFGVFQLEGVSPGAYALVAVGYDGMACIGVNAIPGSSMPANASRPLDPNDPLDRLMAEASPEVHTGSDVIDVCLISPDCSGWLNFTANKLAYDRVVNRPIPYVERTEQPFCGDISSLYCTKNSGMRQFWNMINSYADLVFYGETTGTYNGNGYQSGNPNMMGGCQECGGNGCNTCQPGVLNYQEPGYINPAPIQSVPGYHSVPTPAVPSPVPQFPTSQLPYGIKSRR